MYVNMAVNSSGWTVTSKNCSGLRRIFCNARQAIARMWENASAALGWVARRRPAGRVAVIVLIAVLPSRPHGR